MTLLLPLVITTLINMFIFISQVDNVVRNPCNYYMKIIFSTETWYNKWLEQERAVQTIWRNL